jgi:hypothetical protein
VVRAPAVECSESEHEFAELERLAEVVVGAELEPGHLVVESVGGGEHQDRHAAAGGDDAFGDLVAGGAGDVAVEDGDVVGVDAQQFQSGVSVAGDVCRDRLQAQAVADGLGHVGLVLDDQHTHALDATNQRISSAYRKPTPAQSSGVTSSTSFSRRASRRSRGGAESVTR